MVSVLLSPGFGPYIKGVLSGNQSTKVGIELLRRATPLWKGGADLYNRFLYNLGISANPAQLVMGNDGYMFLGDANYMAYQQDLKRYKISEDDLEKWVDDLACEEKYVAGHNGQMIFLVAPSKGAIYSDKIKGLPEGYKGSESIFDRVEKRAEARGLSILDVRRDLIDARKTADTYSKLDSHWNDYGGYVAWQKIGATIETKMPGVKPVGIGDITGVGTQNANSEAAGLLSLEAPNPWAFPLRAQFFPTYYTVDSNGTKSPVSGDMRTEFGSLPLETYSPNAPNKQRLLVITDSMGAALSPYWTATFQHVKQVVNHIRASSNPLDFEKTVDDFKPDLVFYIMAERYLALPLRPNGVKY